MNVPDPRIFCRSQCRPGTSRSTGTLNLVYHGTMAERLGVDLVMRAVAELRDRSPGVRLHLWGHGDDLGAFSGWPMSWASRRRVLFDPRGFPLKSCPANLRAMDIGVVGNRRSAACDLMLPVKLLEYVSLGIPAVAPRLRTIEHYFSDDMVAYYEPEDVQSLADAIVALYRDPDGAAPGSRRARSSPSTAGNARARSSSTLYQALLEN